MEKAVNNLNSILFEGTVSGEVHVTGEGKAERCTFALSNLRWDRRNGKKTETRVGVIIRDTKLVEDAIKNARDGRGARVVGRIATDEEDNALYIEAEHVGYRSKPQGLKDKEK
jgi:single-stranded DNA-binding protein